jgi:hypothetical protein
MKKRNLFMSVTIMCGFLAIAVTFKIDQITWLWVDSKPVGIVLFILTLVLGFQWMKIQKSLNQGK